MNVLVFRNRFGAAALWVLPPADAPDSDAPEEAHLPGNAGQDPRIQNMACKGATQSWQEWAEYLASQPLLGNWQLQELPRDVRADEALDIVRSRDVRAAATGA